ncbi:transposase-like protein [Bradyrhizobium liaoningense]
MATDFSPEILDQLLAGGSLKPEDLAGEDGLFRRLKKALLERALGAELTHHLGYEKGDPAGRGSGNSRNGTSSKALLTDDGEIEIEVPRDRAGTFEPVIVAKGQTRFDGFDEKIISLYGRGMTVREIQGHLAELLRHRGVPRSDQQGHRRDSRRGPRMAEPAAGSDLSGGLLRRAQGQDSR